MNLKFILSAGWLFLIVLVIGCKKTEPIELNSAYSKVKVFDYKLEDPRNSGMRIAAGNGRFCMAYGYWNEQNPNGATPPSPPLSYWMITDDAGNVIQKDSLPAGYTIGDVLALGDNSFIVLIYDNDQNSTTFGTIQLYHLDQNGRKIKDHSLILPPDAIRSSQRFNLNLYLSVNGNPLLSYYHSWPDNFGFVGELDLNGSFLWYKKYDFLNISDCLNTADGNYIFTGSNDSLHDVGNGFSISRNRVFLFHTSSIGDSLLYRVYKNVDFDYVESVNIIPADNGNYRFCFSHVIDNSVVLSKGFIYEVNSNLDSVNAVELSIKGKNRIEKILPKDDGGLLALMNTTDAVSQWNPSYFYDRYFYDVGNNQLNTRLVYLDSNLKKTGTRTFQNEGTDIFQSACKTKDGRIACFGLIQGYKNNFYQAELIILP